MIEAFRKIWHFAGNERKNINKSVAVGFLNAVLQMFQVAAIYFVVLALTSGEQGGKTAWIALGCELIAIFGGAVSASFSKMLQTHAGYFIWRRIAEYPLQIESKAYRWDFLTTTVSVRSRVYAQQLSAASRAWFRWYL